jgi:hypothetical protein
LREALSVAPGQLDVRRQLVIYEALAAKPAAPAETYDFSDYGTRFAIGIPTVEFSPDGRRMAVVLRVWQPTDEEFLILIDRPSGQIVKLSVGKYVRWVAWSPDAEWVYFLAGTVGTDGRYSALCRSRWNGEDQTTLAPEAWSADLSPDGKRIAFAWGGLWAVDTAGGAPVRLTSGPQDGRPLWFPDGQQVLYSRDTGEAPGDGAPNINSLAKVDVTTGAIEVLRSTPSIYSDLHWAIPGRVAGAIDGWDDRFEWRFIDLGGGEAAEQEGKETVLGLREEGDFTAATWLPGTGAALVARVGEERTERTLELRIVDSGAQVVRAVPLTGFGEALALGRIESLEASPAGPVLLFAYSGPDGLSVWSLGPDDPEPQFVGLVDDGLMTLSPDGQSAAIFTGTQALVFEIP